MIIIKLNKIKIELFSSLSGTKKFNVKAIKEIIIKPNVNCNEYAFIVLPL